MGEEFEINGWDIDSFEKIIQTQTEAHNPDINLSIAALEELVSVPELIPVYVPMQMPMPMPNACTHGVVVRQDTETETEIKNPLQFVFKHKPSSEPVIPPFIHEPCFQSKMSVGLRSILKVRHSRQPETRPACKKVKINPRIVAIKVQKSIKDLKDRMTCHGYSGGEFAHPLRQFSEEMCT